MYKKAWCTSKVVVLLNKPIGVLTFLLPSPLSLLKLPKQSVDFCPFFSWMTFRQNSLRKLFHGLYVASCFWQNPPTMPATAEWHTLVPTNYQMNPSYIEGISEGFFIDNYLNPTYFTTPWLSWSPTPGESRLWRAFNNCTLTKLKNIDNMFFTGYKQSSPRSSGRYNIPYPVSVVNFSVKKGLPFQATCYCRVELRSDISDSLRVFPQPAKAGVFWNREATLPRHLGRWNWREVGTSKNIGTFNVHELFWILQCNRANNNESTFFILNVIIDRFFVRNWVLLYMNVYEKRSAESILMLYIHHRSVFPWYI